MTYNAARQRFAHLTPAFVRSAFSATKRRPTRMLFDDGRCGCLVATLATIGAHLPGGPVSGAYDDVPVLNLISWKRAALAWPLRAFWWGAIDAWDGRNSRELEYLDPEAYRAGYDIGTELAAEFFPKESEEAA